MGAHSQLILISIAKLRLKFVVWYSTEWQLLHTSWIYSDRPLTHKSILKFTFQKRSARFFCLDCLVDCVSAVVTLVFVSCSVQKCWNKNHMVATYTTCLSQNRNIWKKRSFDIVARLFILFLLFVSIYGFFCTISYVRIRVCACLNKICVRVYAAQEWNFCFRYAIHT